MITADSINPRLGELAGFRAAFAHFFSITNLRQVKRHGRK